MRLAKLAVGFASLGLLAAPSSRLVSVVAGTVLATSCEGCELGVILPDSPLPDGRVGMPYFLQFRFPTGTPSCPPGAVKFRRDEGTLPQGMKLSIDGALDGIPALSGTYTFTIAAVWAAYDTEEEAKRTYTLTIHP